MVYKEGINMNELTKKNLFNAKGSQIYKNIIGILLFFKQLDNKILQTKHIRYYLEEGYRESLDKTHEKKIHDYLFDKKSITEIIDSKKITLKDWDFTNFNVRIDTKNKQTNLTFFLNKLGELGLIHRIYFYDKNDKKNTTGYIISEEGEIMYNYNLSHHLIDSLFDEEEINTLPDCLIKCWIKK